VKRALALVAAAAVLAGCGGARHTKPAPPHPRLPRALARAWSREATAIASTLAAKDGCAAKQRAQRLLGEVVAAINAGRIPRALLEPLTSSVNSLPAQITCSASKRVRPGTQAEARARKLAGWLLRYSR
jgi:hypothetical protein